MTFEDLEDKAKNNVKDLTMKRAMALVNARILDIKKLVEKGEGPRRIHGKIFGRNLTYNGFVTAYEDITGEKLVYRGYSGRDLSVYKGRKRIPSFVIDLVIARLSEHEEGDYSYSYHRNNYPKAVERY